MWELFGKIGKRSVSSLGHQRCAGSQGRPELEDNDGIRVTPRLPQLPLAKHLQLSSCFILKPLSQWD